MAGAREDDDRLFVRDGFKHYRRTYSLAEVRWGFAVLGGLVLTVGWVGWTGRRPDPALYAAALSGGAAAAVDRGPVPVGLAPAGWREGAISAFGADNLYVKIDGRADFFLSKGFEQLYFVPLALGDEGPTIDIEVYAMGSAANALGAFAGERGEGDPAEPIAGGGMRRSARNALYLARGPYYVRAIGSDESAVVVAALAALDRALAAGLQGAELPWAYAALAAAGVDATEVVYFTENAFSFGFARDVYAGRLADESELFVTVRATRAEAGALASAFIDGFTELGAPIGDGSAWIRDRYLGALSTASADDRFVFGVHGAAGLDTGAASLARLRDAVAGLGDAQRARAQPAPIAPAEAGAAAVDGRAPAIEVAPDDPRSADGVDDAAGASHGAEDELGY